MTDLYTSKYAAKIASAILGTKVSHFTIAKWSLHGTRGLTLDSVEISKNRRLYRVADVERFARELMRVRELQAGRKDEDTSDEQMVRCSALKWGEDDNHRYAAWRKHDERINGDTQ